MNEDVKSNRLTKTMSLPQVWALALGTSIGWGSLVVTSNPYLLQAGPWGSIVGLLIGCAIMLVIARADAQMYARKKDLKKLGAKTR